MKDLTARCAVVAALVVGGGCAGMGEGAHDSGLFPPRNPFLADSYYPIGHTNSGQVDSTPVPGPA